MRVFMAALQAPGNVEALLRPLQDTLFRDRGWTSARALPPILPLAYADEAESLPPRDDAEADAALQDLQVTETALVVTLSAEAPRGLRAAGAKGNLGAGGMSLLSHMETLPPAGAGLFVAVNEGAVLGHEGTTVAGVENASLPAVPAARIRQWWYVVMELSFHDPRMWWRDLGWRQLERERLRKAG
jgi:hypothetical protein